MVLVSVGFFTLLERRVLGYRQVRKGPNKVGYYGLFQPFSDGLRLFLREYLLPLNSNFLIFFFCPLLRIIHSLFIWILFPFYVNCVEFRFGLIFFLCCSSLGVYILIICGWSSNRSYSMLGCVRRVSQAISYEVSLSLVILCMFILLDRYSFYDLYYFQRYVWFCFISFPLFFCWISCCMAETNRSPFDFSEGESELVSGFNIEYGSHGFAYLFISEYSSIIFIRLLRCLIFIGGDYNSFLFFFRVIFLCYLFIWVRVSFPRYRYDKLIFLSWKCYLPLFFNYFYFFIFIRVIIFYHFFL